MAKMKETEKKAVKPKKTVITKHEKAAASKPKTDVKKENPNRQSGKARQFLNDSFLLIL